MCAVRARNRQSGTSCACGPRAQIAKRCSARAMDLRCAAVVRLRLRIERERAGRQRVHGRRLRRDSRRHACGCERRVQRCNGTAARTGGAAPAANAQGASGTNALGAQGAVGTSATGAQGTSGTTGAPALGVAGAGTAAVGAQSVAGVGAAAATRNTCATYSVRFTTRLVRHLACSL
jgi:hypothetical protein